MKCEDKMESFRFIFVDELARNNDESAKKLLMPKRGTRESSGFDLVAANMEEIAIPTRQWRLVPTGIAVHLIPGFEGQVRSRSGLALKHGIAVLNSPGTIDADYRGEVKVILINHGEQTFVVERGMRIAQLVISNVWLADMDLVTNLEESQRNDGGFGSTGIFNA
jgi:dUTP pyrophosphatase